MTTPRPDDHTTVLSQVTGMPSIAAGRSARPAARTATPRDGCDERNSATTTMASGAMISDKRSEALRTNVPTSTASPSVGR